MRSLTLVLTLAVFSTQASALPAPGERGRIITRGLRQYMKDYDKDPAATPLPAGANKYRYVFVKGLFGNTYPFYMSRAVKALKARGVDVEFAPIDTVQGSLRNSVIIEKMVRETDRPIVFIGHSKGVVDTSTALGRMAKSNSKLLQRNVRGFVALEGAYGGSPIPKALTKSRWGRLTIAGLSKLFRGTPDAAYSLIPSRRNAVNAAQPMPTHLVPTVAFVGYQRGFFSSLMGPLVWLIKKGFGLRSDGLVPTRSAYIPGADIARAPVDHAAGAFGKTSEVLTVGLVSHVLRMQPQWSEQ